jgi:uncharacterized circularly permuted ATP-grasp superfamily protein
MHTFQRQELLPTLPQPLSGYALLLATRLLQHPSLQQVIPNAVISYMKTLQQVIRAHRKHNRQPPTIMLMTPGSYAQLALGA